MERNECSFPEGKAPVEEQNTVKFELKEEFLHKSGMKFHDALTTLRQLLVNATCLLD
jgi:hypothetical protein